MNHLFLPCPKGCEELLLEEAQALGLQAARLRPALVYGEGDRDCAYRLCLYSRLASRVLWQLAEGEVHTLEELDALCRSIAWEEHLDADTSFAVRFFGHGCGIRNSQFGALKVKDAIVDRLRDKFHRRPDVDKQNPDLSFDAFLQKRRFSLSIDLAGRALNQRGYRAQQGEAPLKENLAAAILYRGNWQHLLAQDASFLDPFCGSGTLGIEAAWMAYDHAPGLLRESFGFERWLQHIPKRWQGIRDEALQRATRGKERYRGQIFLFDNDARAIAATRRNAQIAGCETTRFHVEQSDVLQLFWQDRFGTCGLLASNPPYGERLGQAQDWLEHYHHLGAAFKGFPSAWRLALLSDQNALIQRMHLRFGKNYQLHNGPLETTLWIADRATQPEALWTQSEVVQASTKADEQQEMLFNRLQKNLKQHGKIAKKRGIEAYRLYDADMPEYAFAVDLYADHVHVQEYAPPESINADKAAKRRLDFLAVLPKVLGVPAEKMIVKERRRQLGKEQYEKQDNRRHFFTVREGAAQFYVNLHDYLDSGLFLDHRLLRQHFYEIAAHKSFLNLFCYTATASVHAALSGATHSLSIDLSNTYLDWAQRNFELNHLSHAHEVLRADVMQWLVESEERFDLIFCDPPTFSNTRSTGRRFAVDTDQIALIQGCMRHLTPNGILYFSNNFKGFKLDETLQRDFQIEDISARSIDFDFRRRPNIHQLWRIRQG